ncbi:MAG: endonuclease domain-containing protein [Saprospiraceae bacterium]|nr:endonuclease domain-containing protein [Saprospiraceae bacterium]
MDSPMPKPEACLWKFALSKRQMLGYQFRRQRPIGPFIADFACLPLMLVIEVDGFSHQSEEAMIKDQKRAKYLEAFGFTVLRFSNWEVLNEIDKVNVVKIEDLTHSIFVNFPGSGSEAAKFRVSTPAPRQGFSIFASGEL